MPTLNTLVSFNGTNGQGIQAGLTADAAGDLFGTTLTGNGTVFEIANIGGFYASTPATLVTFNGANGQYPYAGLITGTAGDLFGTTQGGGAYGEGTVFEIVNTATGYASIPTTLVSFDSANGQYPYAGLIADAAGNLFGTTDGGGAGGVGTVFEIANTATGYASTPTTLVSFNRANGQYPEAGLIADAAGDLFGTTDGGGAGGAGTVFEIVNTATGYASTPTTLVSFNVTDGQDPRAGLIADGAGDLFGTTYGGGANGDGTVFEIINTASGYASAPVTLVNFNFTNGANPYASLITDAAGNLFGTTSSGGENGQGTVFEIANTVSGYASVPTLLISFNGTNGQDPQAGLIADAAGDLFGTTYSGGTSGDGTAFELTNTGFQVACYRRGTRLDTPAGERAVESLAAGDLVLTNLGNALPIIWIGNRHVDCRRHPKPEKVWPVRIHPEAFGAGLPRRDLWLSPDHAVFVDDALIPIKHLMNGTTIEQVPVDDVTYYHIELHQHDILLAEGLPAESYLDTGNRSLFTNLGGAMTLHPEFDTPKTWSDDAAAPLATDEARVRLVWECLAARSCALGMPIPEATFTDDPEVRLQMNGRTIRPVVVEPDHCVFVLPKHTGPVRLVSRSGYPTDSRPWADDRRRLGVYVTRIIWHDREGPHDMPVDHPLLGAGWWQVEHNGDLLRRWTDGNALLPLASDVIMVEVRFAGHMTYRTGTSEPAGQPSLYSPASAMARAAYAA